MSKSKRDLKTVGGTGPGPKASEEKSFVRPNYEGVMARGAHEIERLRRDNQVMSEKLWLVENLLALRHLNGPSQGFAPCVATELRVAASIEAAAKCGPVPAKS